MSRKKERTKPPIYEYAETYCLIENGRVVGFNWDKINLKQREIDALLNEPTKGEWKK